MSTLPANPHSNAAERMVVLVEDLMARTCGNRALGFLAGPVMWVLGKLMERRMRRAMEQLLEVLRQIAERGLPELAGAPAGHAASETSNEASGEATPRSAFADRPNGAADAGAGSDGSGAAPWFSACSGTDGFSGPRGTGAVSADRDRAAAACGAVAHEVVQDVVEPAGSEDRAGAAPGRRARHVARRAAALFRMYVRAGGGRARGEIAYS